MKRNRKQDEYGRLLAHLRAGARSEEPDWEEAAWHRAVAKATAEEPAAVRRAPGRGLRWAWAGAAAVLILGAGTVATVNLLHRPPGGGGGFASGRNAGRNLEVGAVGETAQDQISLTLVSSESGLRVHWYFDKDFDWKEEK
jgi:hypothetical protein